MDASVQLPPSLYTGQDPSWGTVLPTVGDLPTLIIVIKTVLNRLVWRPISQLILGSVKLTANSALHIGNNKKGNEELLLLSVFVSTWG